MVSSVLHPSMLAPLADLRLVQLRSMSGASSFPHWQIRFMMMVCSIRLHFFSFPREKLTLARVPPADDDLSSQAPAGRSKPTRAQQRRVVILLSGIFRSLIFYLGQFILFR